MGARRANRIERWSYIAQIIESGAAVGALALAGWWFVEQRESYARADLSQSIAVVGLERGTVAVEATVSVKNAGNRLLRLHRARVRLQEASGTPFAYHNLSQVDGPQYWGPI